MCAQLTDGEVVFDGKTFKGKKARIKKKLESNDDLDSDLVVQYSNKHSRVQDLFYLL